MKIELVSHCFRYPTLLRYQLSSLVLWPPPDGTQVTATVFFTEEDAETTAVLRWFAQRTVPGVVWNWQELPVLRLCRRSIGRNLAALTTKADWVWFCDADYWFKTECWTKLVTVNEKDGPLIFPKHVLTQREHALGDLTIEGATQNLGIVSANAEEFEPRRMNRAIGGIQIVRGEFCREKGYLPNDDRAQCPTREAIFEKNLADVWFRESVGVKNKAVELPDVFRIRHSQAGRFVPGLKL
ncbi:MAG: glycosyltransferase [Verrucomicrobia bacterium]|nr:glycosyltransferase [Verrucomicrobiota bacterium]